MSKHVRDIATLMEMGDMGGLDNDFAPAAGTTEVSMEIMPGDPEMQEQDVECEESFKPEEINMARDLIAMVGSADRVRELIDKVDDAMEVFDQSDENDAETIDMIAGLMPSIADMPTMTGPLTIGTLAKSFDPNQ